jgi:hypothetical protein
VNSYVRRVDVQSNRNVLHVVLTRIATRLGEVRTTSKVCIFKCWDFIILKRVFSNITQPKHAKNNEI